MTKNINTSLKVFLSYRWENNIHEKKVLALANELINNGIDCKLDKIEQALNKGNPDWKLWIDRELPTAHFILVICTESYKNCFNSEESCTGEGGVEYEARLIRNKLKDNNVLPIIFNTHDKEHIPLSMRSLGRYNLFEAQFNVYDYKSGYCALVRKITDQPQFDFPEVGKIPILPPDNDDVILNKGAIHMSEQYQFIIDYLNTNAIHKDNLIEVCKKYLEKVYIDILVKYQSLDEVIKHIYNYKQFPCIVKEFYQSYNEELKSWLDNKNLASCLEIKSIEDTPRVVIIFTSRHIDQKYNVTFISKNLPNIPDSKSDEDYDLDVIESKNRLIVEIMNYVQNSNPKVDLVLPTELLVKDINLWKVNFNESLSRLSRVNIRYIGRYNVDDNLKDLIRGQWNNILNKIADNKNLYCIEDENYLDNVGNNMIESGIASKYILQEKHFDYLLKTEMSYIMLWFTKENTQDLSSLYSVNLQNLQDEYYRLQNSPINLMWDDPTTYYYPDEIQGDSNERN